MLPNNINQPSGTNAPGIGNEILFAPVSWFSTIAEPPSVGTTPGETIIITDDHVFEVQSPTLGFITMYTTIRSGEITYKQVGEIDSYGIDGMIEAFSPGINEALLELMGIQDQFIVLIKDIDCANTRYFQLGASCSPSLKREWEFKSGKGGGEGKKGTTVKFDSYGDRVLIYTGAVTLAEQPAES